jgi:hypothetical protein
MTLPYVAVTENDRWSQPPGPRSQHARHPRALIRLPVSLRIGSSSVAGLKNLLGIFDFSHNDRQTHPVCAFERWQEPAELDGLVD